MRLINYDQCRLFLFAALPMITDKKFPRKYRQVLDIILLRNIKV